MGSHKISIDITGATHGILSVTKSFLEELGKNGTVTASSVIHEGEDVLKGVEKAAETAGIAALEIAGTVVGGAAVQNQ